MKAKIKWILLLNIYYNHNYVISYFYDQSPYYRNPAQPDYDYEGMADYPQPYTSENRRIYTRYNRYQDYYQEDCSDKAGDCSCDNCQNPTPCCVAFCSSCPNIRGPPMYYVPYPFPVMMPVLNNKTTPKTTASTAKATTTATPKVTTTKPTQTTKSGTITVTIVSTTEKIATDTQVNIVNDEYNKYANQEWNKLRSSFKMNERSQKYMATPLRRMKPTNWVSKYGLLPLPENFAEKLMSQLRQVKGLNDE